MLCCSIDNEKEVRVTSLDIAKEFDRVWHAGILDKLQNAGIFNSIQFNFISANMYHRIQYNIHIYIYNS